MEFSSAVLSWIDWSRAALAATSTWVQAGDGGARIQAALDEIARRPAAHNYAISCVGAFTAGDWAPNAPRGVIESSGAPVLPRSLYLAQLAARLGPAAVSATTRK